MTKPAFDPDNQALNPAPIITGNAREKDWADSQRGWFIGHFVDPSLGLRRTTDLEVKWGEHKPGEARTAPGTSLQSTTLTLLISGSFVVEFPGAQQTVHLTKTGDYVIFGPGVSHTWTAQEESVVLTVRWPSIDQNDPLTP